MVVPSAEVHGAHRFHFLAVVLRQTQDIEETERQLGSYGRRHSHTSRCASSPSAPASTSQTEAAVSAGVPKPLVGRELSRAASRPLSASVVAARGTSCGTHGPTPTTRRPRNPMV